MHHRASFKTKRSFSINKCLYLLHMDLFGPVKPQSISHNKYTLVIVDEYSRKMENLNEVRVKELRSDNETEFINHKLEELCDEKAARTMLHSANLPKQFWGEAVNTACYTQNKSIIVKRHGKIAYDVFRGRSPNISYFHVFGCLVHIHNHKDHLGKLDEKVNDGFFLGYSPVAKAFRVFNIRRQEIEESYQVTFSEDDDAISQSSTEGNAVNFNENRSFPDDEFLEPRNKVTHSLGNVEYFPYDSGSPSEQTGFPIANNHLVQNEVDYSESADNLELVELNLWLVLQLEAGSETQKLHQLMNVWNKFWTLVPKPHGLKANRIFLAYAVYMGFVVFQMDVKSAFLNRKILEEVSQSMLADLISNFPHVSVLGLWYPKGSGFDLKAYSNFDYTGCNLDRKSTLGGCQVLGGKLVCWSAKKQSSVTMSSAEAAYVAAVGCCAQVLWIKSQLADYDFIHDKHFIRDYILKGDIELYFVPTEVQLADIFTKPLAEPSFTRLVAELGRWCKELNHLLTPNFDKLVSFTLDEFIYVIGLNYSENYVLAAKKETVRAGLETLRLVEEDKPSLSSTTLDGKKGIESNVCYTRYLSLMIENFLEYNYTNNDLTLLKLYTISAASFKKPFVTPPDGAWTVYVSGGVTLLSISSTKHKERPLRVETSPRGRRESRLQPKQTAVTQPVEELVVTTNTTQSLDASELTEEQGTSLRPLKPKRSDTVQEHNVEEEVKSSRLTTKGDITFEQLMDEYEKKNDANKKEYESPC
ncbi:retrovirus-related pol polyprotein from transposon TNT 1-94 [Tanacetum coccineum]